MKKFILGGIAGYLLTSLFSIPAPPPYFWYFTGGLAIVSLIFFLAWRRFNDDLHEGDW